MKRIHFMGIGGVGMSGLAILLSKAGHAVSGCDKYASPRTRWLEANGIVFSEGHSPSHLSNIDELIITPAVPPDSPELVAARAAGIPIRYRGTVLAEVVNASYGIAVCGTHGKTTTSTFTTKLLRQLGLHPSWCIGGETGNMPVANSKFGIRNSESLDNSEFKNLLIVEADESDGTLALYRPKILVLNAVDFDHLEHFDSPEAYFECYRTAIRNTSDAVIVCAEHAKALSLARESIAPGVRLITFGFSPDCDISAADRPELSSIVSGRHNVLNALAAIAVAKFGIPNSELTNNPEFRIPNSELFKLAFGELPDRRFQTIVQKAGVTVITDYAHHPAELACAVDMARALKPRRLRVLFQPHRYSRTRALLSEFPPAFAQADEVVLIPVYAAFEAPIPGGDIADLYKAFVNSELGIRNSEFKTASDNSEFRIPNSELILARSADEAWRHVFLSAEPGDLILLAGAGDIINLMPRVKADFDSLVGDTLPTRTFTSLAPLSFFRTGGATCGGGERVIVGMGSNTWFSDCASDIEIVKPDLPTGASIIADRPDLAFMRGIPGTIGGWVKMNAGAFGHSIGEFVRRVKVDGKWIDRADCGFAYRHSNITGIIEDVELESEPRLLSRIHARERKVFPSRTCGSVFKNPSPDTPAGRLLDEAGAKSLRVGGASVWSEHANVIIAGKNCTSSDILALARLMAAAVREKFNINLIPEIRGLLV